MFSYIIISLNNPARSIFSSGGRERTRIHSLWVVPSPYSLLNAAFVAILEKQILFVLRGCCCAKVIHIYSYIYVFDRHFYSESQCIIQDTFLAVSTIAFEAMLATL